MKTHIGSEADILVQGNVYGALLNDLAAPGQGVCEITLHFKHEYISNLEIELISPAGQKVNLVGVRQTNTNTSGSIWNVTFVRCSVTPSPDAGVPAKWTNAAPWSIGNTYAGTYHPNLGCLEDFNTGPVNGTWVLHITNGLFYEGDFLGFSLKFCDDAGITCVTCDPKERELTAGRVDFCQKDSLLAKFIPSFTHPNGIPDSMYESSFLLIDRDKIIAIDSIFNGSQLLPGKYIIQSITFLKRFRVEVFSALYQPFSYLTTELDNSVVCGGLSLDSIELNIHPTYDLPLDEVIICAGDTFLLGNKDYSRSQIIRQNFPTAFGCDSIINIKLTMLKPEIIISVDSIDCSDNVADLYVTSLIQPNVPFQLIQRGWYDTNDNLLSSNDTLRTNIPGTYRFNLTTLYGNLLCKWDTLIEVPSYKWRPNVPVLKVGPICSGMLSQLIVDQDTLSTGAVWSIEGNGLISSHGDTANVYWTQPGSYEVCVHFQSPCGNSDTLCTFIKVNPMPAYSILFDSVTCDGYFRGGILGASAMLVWSDLSGTSVLYSASDHYYGTLNPGIDSTYIRLEGEIAGCSLIDSVKVKRIPVFYFSGFADTTVCSGSRVTYNLISNIVPLDIAYRLNGVPSVFHSEQYNSTLSWEVTTDQVLIIDSVNTSYSGCRQTISDTFKITAQSPPFASFSPDLTLCNGLSPTGEAIYFPADFIVSGDVDGDWNFSSITGLIMRNDSIDLSNVVAGSYLVFFQTTSGKGICSEQFYTLSIKVVDCICPPPGDLNINSGHNQFCIDTSSIDLNLYFDIQIAGRWYILDSNTMTNSLLINSILPVRTLNEGNYRLTFSAEQDWAGACPDSINFEIVIHKRLFAGLDSTLQFCAGDSTLISLNSLTRMSSSGGQWIPFPANFPGLSKAYDPFSKNLKIIELGPGILIFKYITRVNAFCPADTATFKFDIHRKPSISLSGDEYLNCRTQETQLQVLTDSSNIFKWYFNGNYEPAFDEVMTRRVVLDGVYKILAIDTVSGCSGEASIEISPSGHGVTSFAVVSGKRSCNDSLFSLVVSAAVGGKLPLSFRVDAGEFLPYPQFYSLKAGSHIITIRDAAGCERDTLIRIDPKLKFSLWLGRDTVIYEGDSVLINVQNSSNLPGLDYKWLDKDALVASSVDAILVEPDATTVYSVYFTDADGCTYSDELRVVVKSADEFYVPNLFSPNNDGINDYFYIPFNKRITSILKFDIFDRWGNHLFGKANILPGDEFAGWDGTFHGKVMNPSVFVFKLVYKNSRGEILERFGTFGLIR